MEEAVDFDVIVKRQYMINNELISNHSIFHICAASPLPPPPHKETKYEHFLQRSPTVMEYLLKREECALICQGDLS